jgi:ATP-dependent Clp protease protease subunit
MGLLLRERIVFIPSEINDFSADAVISQLLLLDAQDPKKDIRLLVNSIGGSASATMALYDVIRLVRADVSTIAMGIAASTAAIILAAGAKGKRFAMPNTRIMIQQPVGGASGQVNDVEVQANEIKHTRDNVARIMSECTGQPLDKITKDLDRDKYMSAMEAVEYGVIDGVIDRDYIIPLMPVPDLVPPKHDADLLGEGYTKYITPVISDDEVY